MFKECLLILSLLIPSGLGFLMPVAKPNGSVDLSSLTNHLTFIEQTMRDQKNLLKASQSELESLKIAFAVTNTDLTNVNSDLKTAMLKITATQDELKSSEVERTVLKFQMNAVQEQNSKLEGRVSSLSTNIASLSDRCACDKDAVQSSNHNQTESVTNGMSGNGGATYIRWGRSTCPAGSDLVYEGFTGGPDYVTRAGPSNTLCLPKVPIYGNHSKAKHGPYVYGTEYEATANRGLTEFQNLQDEDMPCAVCQSPTKTSAILVPARNQCLPGWSLEYSGYLMAPHVNTAAGQYICVDGHPESVVGGQRNDNGQLMYLVEAVCGSLPCPPYQQYWELTCCVCSR